MPNPVTSSILGWRPSSDRRTRAIGLLELGLLALVVLVMTLMSATARSATAGTTTFTPVADSYVQSDQPTTNYGTSTQVRTDGSPFVRAYLRFDVQGLSGPVSSAILRVYANSGHSTGYAVSAVADTSWGETTIIYNNAPAIAATPTGSSGAFSAGAWTQVDVTSLVQGNGLVSLALTTTSSTAMSLASRESGANAPQLVVTAAAASDTTPPAAPTAVTATADSATQATVSWKANTESDLAGYRISRASSGGTPAQVGTAGPGVVSFTNAGLSPETAYSYTVVAFDTANNLSPASAPATVTTHDTTAPTAPTNLTATATSSSAIALSWSASSDDVGVTGYDIFRDGATTPLASVTTTSYTETGLAPNTTYGYTVRAHDAAGHSSDPASASTTTPAAPDTTPPTAPTNVTATTIGTTQVSLTWGAATDNVGVTGYRVLRGTTQVGTPTATGFTDTGLSPSTPYDYTVVAVDAANNATSSAPPLTVTTLADTTAPTAPSNLTATATSSSAIALSWSASSDDVGVTGYDVFHTGDSTLLASVTTTSYTETGLSPNTTYGYTVRARDAAGHSSDPASASTTTPADATPPAAPANLRSTAVGPNQVSLAWDPATDNVAVTGYRVFRGAAQVGTPTATSFTDTGLTTATAYTYTVKAIDAAGNLGPASNALAVTTADNLAPTAPANLRSTSVGPNQVSLAWDAATDNVGVTGYRVFRGATQVGTPTATSFTDSGLSPSTAYSYTVKAIDAAGNLGAASNALSVTTSAPTAGDPVIAAAGDIACDPSNSNFSGASSGSCQQRAVSDLLVGANLSAVLPLGDNQYYCGGLQAFQQSFDPSWGRVKPIIRPAVGNHEYLTSGGTGCDSTNANAQGYFSYFGAAASPATNGYYSYDIGAWHLIALNSQCSAAGGCSSKTPQGKWLANDLATHKNLCTLAYWHVPLFSSGGRASSTFKTFWDQLYAAGVDVVLNGHDHTYERFAPQTPSGGADPARGIREFVVGTGGANHTSFTTIFANSEVRNDSTFGVLKLTLHPGGYDWGFVPQKGDVFTDAGSGSCH